MLKIDQNWLNRVMGGKPMNPLDRITPKQKGILTSRDINKMFSDWDGDGVINGLDCQPRNKMKHSMDPSINPKNYRVTDDAYYLGKQATDRSNFKKKMEDIWLKD